MTHEMPMYLGPGLLVVQMCCILIVHKLTVAIYLLTSAGPRWLAHLD